MSELKPRITENGIDYILVGDYYIPDLKLLEEHRPIGKYGRLHRKYLSEVNPARLNTLILTGELWTYLADLNEQTCCKGQADRGTERKVGGGQLGVGDGTAALRT